MARRPAAKRTRNHDEPEGNVIQLRPDEHACSCQRKDNPAAKEGEKEANAVVVETVEVKQTASVIAPVHIEEKASGHGGHHEAPAANPGTPQEKFDRWSEHVDRIVYHDVEHGRLHKYAYESSGILNESKMHEAWMRGETPRQYVKENSARFAVK